jgi:hypothetical protein
MPTSGSATWPFFSEIWSFRKAFAEATTLSLGTALRNPESAAARFDGQAVSGAASGFG